MGFAVLQPPLYANFGMQQFILWRLLSAPIVYAYGIGTRDLVNRAAPAAHHRKVPNQMCAAPNEFAERLIAAVCDVASSDAWLIGLDAMAATPLSENEAIACSS